MSSNQRNARLDQFFPSKKIKCLSPSGKIVKTNKDVKSPNTKGSLDGYLVKSLDGLPSPDNTSSAQYGLKRGDAAKQNLTFEVKQPSTTLDKALPESAFIFQQCSSVSQLASSSPVKGKKNEQVKKAHGKEVYRGSLLVAENMKVSNEKHGSAAVFFSEAEDSSTHYCVEDQISRCNGNSEELSQFANNFLAVCCSGLVSKENALLEESLPSQKLNKHKRSGSPSRLSANKAILKKKQCGVGANKLIEIVTEGPKISHEGSEDVINTENDAFAMRLSELEGLPVGGFADVCKETENGQHDGNGQLVAQPTSRDCKDKKADVIAGCLVSQAMQNSENVSEADGQTKMPGFSTIGTPQFLRKCCLTPEIRTDQPFLCTPKTISIKGSAIKTPGWVYRSSFSPGDEFWNEAIQVADGLVSVKTDDAVEDDCKVSICTDGQDEQGNLQSDKGTYVKSYDLDIRTDNGIFSSKIQPHLCKDNTEQTESEAHPQIVASSKVPVSEECILNKDKINAGRVGLSKTFNVGSSPLPVRHFDFQCEDHIIIDNTGDIEKGKHSKDDTSMPDPETRGDIENSVFAIGNAKASEKIIGHVDHHDDTIKTLKASVAEVDDISTSKDNNVGTPSSGSTSKDFLELSYWLPQKLCNVYAKKGITKLYPWQVECLQLDGVLERKNLVYCASTSAGKSLVAEVVLLRRVISTGKKALLVLPYVSLCAEKTEHLETLLEPLNKRVRSFYGVQGSGTLPKDTSVAVCTIEKANSLVNRLLEEDRLAEVGVMVIDELHMVGDQSRGYLLELMLTKLLYAAGGGGSGTSNGDSPGNHSGKTDPSSGMQIVGMSATMPNVAAVANWLQAALYETEFRPIPLSEYIKVGNVVYSKTMEVVRTIRKGADLGGKDPDHVVELCNEVIQGGHSVLVFCSSRKACETTARHIAKFIKEFASQNGQSSLQWNDALSVVEELRKSPAGLDPTLAETLPSRVAFHHAGLTVEEREIVETCYRQGNVRVLTATSTLAAGVNLPARRVIFRQPRIGRDFIDGTRYKQMSGRAGRAGIDTKGESIILCKPEEVKRITTLLNESCPPLKSCLAEDKNGMKRAILEVVAGGIVQTANDIHRYVRCTLLNSTQPFEDVVKSAQDSLYWLCHAKFLEWDQKTQIYSTTPLGRAAFGSSLSPEESMIVLEDLARAREGFVLASDLHLLYEVTPINVDIEPDWELYYQRFMELSSLDQAVGNRVGVMEPFLMRMAHGAPIMQLRDKSSRNGKSPRDKSSRSFANSRSKNTGHPTEQTLRVCRRFYVALMLGRLVEEVPLTDVCEAFKVPRGTVQSLQENAGRFASMVSAFCERLGWHDLEGLVSKFQNRVSFGVRAEIAELTSIPFVKGARARALYKAGLRTPQAVAEASLPELVKALFEASSWAAEDGSRSDVQYRIQMGVAKKIKNGARHIVLDRAEEARMAAFSAFKSLGLNVPVALSQPVDASSFGASRSEDHSVALSSEAIVENNFDVKILNDKVFRDPRSGLLDMTAHTTTVGAYTNDGEENGKDKSSVIVIESGAIQDTVETKQNDTNYLSNERHNETAVGEGAAGLNVELRSKDSGNVINKENILIAKDDEKSNVRNAVEAASMFAGFKIVPETNHDMQNLCEAETACISNNGPVDVISMNGGFDSFLNKWEQVNEFCFDLHFSNASEGDSSAMFEVQGLAVCWETSPVYYLNFSRSFFKEEDGCATFHNGEGTANSNQQSNYSMGRFNISKERWKRVAKVMCQKGVNKITWNLKSQLQALKKPGTLVPKVSQNNGEVSEDKSEATLTGMSLMLLPSIDIEEAIDICIVAWLLWPDEESTYTPTLEQEVKKRLSGEVAAAANRAGRWSNQMGRVAHNGCCRRVAQVRALHSILWKLIRSEGLVQVLRSLEMPLVRVLSDMEKWGIGVNMEACRQARCVLEQKLKELAEKAQTLSGVRFSLSTPADVANVLYGHLKLPVPEGCNKGKQHPSTDKHALDLLRHHHPVVGVIKEHRTLAKLLNSTIASVMSRSRLYEGSQIHSIHGHWLQTSTATGRLSMEEPNLQRVEHEVDLTLVPANGDDIEAVNLGQYQINARDFFLPTQENWLLISADYSQIELRLMAHFSDDASLINLLRKPDGDVFIMMAARWTGKNESEITEKQRDHTKKLVYGILYGMGVNTLAEQLECSVGEAGERYERFKSAFPGVSLWLQQAVDNCRQKGYITTLSGRKRFLGKINFGSRGEQAKAERQAVNSICQGSAADIIKMAMLKVHSTIAGGNSEEISESSVKSECLVSGLKGQCRLLLQIHDELLLEVNPVMVREAAALVRSSMEGAACLKVPLRVKLQVGRTWGSLKPFSEVG